MKRKIIKSIFFVFILITTFNISNTCINALPYYDLRFEKISEDLIKGEYEVIGDEIKLQEDTEITTVIKKAYNIDVNASLSKEEEDAISQIFGTKWNQEIEISKEEDIKVEGNVDTYIEVRPIYKEIRGYLIQDYNSWSKKKEVIIKIPVDIEYKCTTKF